MLPFVSSLLVSHLGSFPCLSELTTGPGFLSSTPTGDIIVAQFSGDPLEKDVVSVVEFSSILNGVNVSNLNCKPITNAITWPNFVEFFSLGGGVSGVLAPGGFLVPPKTVGAVSVLDVNFSSAILKAPPAVLTKPKILPGDGWFYHKAFFFDVDGDGLKDVLAARCTKPLVESPAGELIWLRNPSPTQPFSAPNLPWSESVLANSSWSPDVSFTSPSSIRGDKDSQIFYTSFFTGGGLAFLQCSGCNGGGNNWATAELTLTILDASIGPSFDVAVEDLNGDGTLDLLVTNHADNATAPHIQSGVFAYLAPPMGVSLTDSKAWTKHTLASGFEVREPGPNQAAPGEATAFRLSGVPKPFILVSGDGEQRLTVLEPLSPGDPKDWGYARRALWDCKGTSGKQVVLEIGGAKYIAFPCYDSGEIHVFSVQQG